jgi:chemotaxis regulatin CheY-phosphate phosphatase CheZ
MTGGAFRHGKETHLNYSVSDLTAMARALSEGEFEEQFQQHFQGELGQLASYLDAVRQTLLSLSATADGSRELIPMAANGVAEINREAENSFNSVWEVIERLQSDQAEARTILKESDDGLSGEKVNKLREIAEKHQQELLSLMSYLSFQDVLRQRLEKIQRIIGQVEDKTLELIVKCKVKANEKSLKDGDGDNLVKDADLDQNLVDQLMATLR